MYDMLGFTCGNLGVPDSPILGLLPDSGPSGLCPLSVHVPILECFPSPEFTKFPQWPWKRAGTTHISQVQNEAVTIVEAVPGHRHLSGTDYTASFDLEEPLHHHLIGYHVLESRRHASFLSSQGDSVNPREKVQGHRSRGGTGLREGNSGQWMLS